MRLLFNFFNKILYKVKASGLQLSFNIFRLPSAWHKIKKKLYKTLDYWFRGILNSDFLEKGLGIVSTLLYMIFQEKMFLVLHSINWPNFIVRLPSWVVGQIAYCKCLFLRLWRHKFCYWPYLSQKWSWTLECTFNNLDITFVKDTKYSRKNKNPANICMFKFNKRNLKKSCEISLKLTINTAKQSQ